MFIRLYPYGVFPIDFEFPEHRVYQQLEFLQEYQKIDITHHFDWNKDG